MGYRLVGLRYPMIKSFFIDPRIKVRNPKELLNGVHIIRVNSFDEDAVKSFSSSFSMALQTGQPVIPLIIDSYGGDIYSLFAMADIISKSPVPVSTFIQGKAMSCGAILFCCGTKGYKIVGPNATLMIHDVSWETTRKKTCEIKGDAKEVMRINKKAYSLIDQNIGKHSGYTEKLVKSNSRADVYLTPKQCVRLGFADKVGIPSLTSSVVVNFDFSVKLS